MDIQNPVQNRMSPLCASNEATIFSTPIRPCRNQRAASSGLYAFQAADVRLLKYNGILPPAKTGPEIRSLPPAKIGRYFASRQKPGNAGWSSPVARQAHNLKAAGSNPAPATKTKNPARRNPAGFWRFGKRAAFILLCVKRGRRSAGPFYVQRL